MKRMPVSVSPEEFEKIIQNTKSKHHKVAFLLGYGAGLRISEIVGAKRMNGKDIPKLTPDKISFKERRIFISNAKENKDRIVPLPKGLREEHLKYIPFRCSSRALEIAFKNACRKAGLLIQKPDLHFHSLRHGFATNAVNQGMPIHHVRTLLGHSNISTTNVYLEANPKDALKSYEELF